MRKPTKLPAPPAGETRGDHAKSALKVIAGLLPLGGVLSEVVEHVVGSPAEKRMNAWLGDLVVAINDLIERVDGPTEEELSTNEAFLTAVVSTTRSAMLTSRREKLAILRNVVVRTGEGLILEEFMRNTFLSVIDRYTPEHIWLLERLARPSDIDAAFEVLRREVPSAIGSDREGLEHANIEDLAPRLLDNVSTEVARELFTDLHQDRLCHGSEGFAHSYAVGRENLVLTLRGREFLKLVTSGTEIC